ncbi:hypothetical protein L204_103073 [Cryptococcus depauperatus]|nr:hypothetical protein L204_00178 [Cryptococcus depauperatus CBS 7855]
MAQVIPSITSLPSDSGAAPSVEDIQDHLPSICVDYLSHVWSEEDVWASWRNMTRHKHEIANGVRLENASWRTWQKQRNKLKTISPETLNWLKDSDVTWLYGPLHTANVEPVRPLKVSPADERLGFDRPDPDNAAGGSKKPILKHRTISEMLTKPKPSPILEFSDSNGLDNMDDDGDRPIIHQTKSDTNILRNRGAMPRRRSPPRHHYFGLDKTPIGETNPMSPTDSNGTNRKHISFNTFVEQCVAVEGRDQDAAQQVQSDSDDEMLEMKPSSHNSKGSRPSLSRHSSSGAGTDNLTIAKIAPTMLKTGPGVNPNLQMVYAPPPEYQSPNENINSYDFPSPQIDPNTGKWQQDEDEYGSGQFDYFGGPNLGTEVKREQVVSSSSGTNLPQDRSEPPSISSSSSSSSFNVTSSPQPGRGILKVRQAGQPLRREEPASPPSAYFDYNPSAATGIGSMRGSSGGYDYGPTGSPITSPIMSVGEERGRGRQPSRERLHDRPTSRGTSNSSISSNSSRSPTDPSSSRTPRKAQTPSQLGKVQEESQYSEHSEHAVPAKDVQAVGSDQDSQPPAHALDPTESNKEIKDYVPDRSSTPTPHSSPQIAFHPLKDTSPASLPHTSTNTRSFDLPQADPPTSVLPTFRSNPGTRATIAHVGTNAHPTLSQPVDDDDGASIMGRAANIASTAKDILGALWYGANDGQGSTAGQGTYGQGQRQRQGSGNDNGAQGKGFHRRSGST